jgi:hypothetical protein
MLFRQLGDLRRPGFDRYITILRALIEAAILSWIATLGCALAWNFKSGCDNEPKGYLFYHQETCFTVKLQIHHEMQNVEQ